jgi:hypothetical protein
MTDDDLGDLYAAMPDPPDEQSASALAEASTWVGTHGVEAVGLGEDEAGGPCIVVYTSGSADDLPTVVGGLPLRAEQTGPVQAYDAQPDPPAQAESGD